MICVRGGWGEEGGVFLEACEALGRRGEAGLAGEERRVEAGREAGWLGSRGTSTNLSCTVLTCLRLMEGEKKTLTQ